MLSKSTLFFLLALLIPPLALAGPCDIYNAGGFPCVAAHSTVRRLLDSYTGPLYEVTRGSDNVTTTISATSNGVANGTAQDEFCSRATCLITVIYDQSGMGNDLMAAPPGGAAFGPESGGYDFVASAIGARVSVGGQIAYGVFTTLSTGYRNDKTKGIATGNDPEGIYAVVDGTHYNSACCWDYGNAETNDRDNGQTHMEALYFGSASGTANGTGNGPWFQADLENGLFAGNQSGGTNPDDPSIEYRFATGIVKGNSSNLWAIRGGDAQSGNLSNFYSGPRPAGYYPMIKEGAIILGIGGDNSNGAQGTFYEGIMTTGYPNDEVEDQVQANIVAAGYNTTIEYTGQAPEVGSNITLQTSGDGSTYIGNNGSEVYIMSSDNTTQANITYTVQTGNNGHCFSFESVGTPGTYLRHFSFKLYSDSPDNKLRSPTTFVDDSTFCPEPGFTGSGTAFRSWSFPTRFFRRVNDGEVYIGTQGGPLPWDYTNDFNDQATFLPANGTA